MKKIDPNLHFDVEVRCAKLSTNSLFPSFIRNRSSCNAQKIVNPDNEVKWHSPNCCQIQIPIKENSHNISHWTNGLPHGRTIACLTGRPWSTSHGCHNMVPKRIFIPNLMWNTTRRSLRHDRSHTFESIPISNRVWPGFTKGTIVSHKGYVGSGPALSGVPMYRHTWEGSIPALQGAWVHQQPCAEHTLCIHAGVGNHLGNMSRHELEKLRYVCHKSLW